MDDKDASIAALEAELAAERARVDANATEMRAITWWSRAIDAASPMDRNPHDA